MGLEIRDVFHWDSVQGAGTLAPTFLMAEIAGTSCFCRHTEISLKELASPLPKGSQGKAP